MAVNTNIPEDFNMNTLKMLAVGDTVEWKMTQCMADAAEE